MLFPDLAERLFPAIRKGMERLGRPASDRDAFLTVKEAVELVRALRPEEGLGEAIDEVVALAHHAWMYWNDGQRTVGLDRATIVQLPARRESGARPTACPPVRRSAYFQVPERLLWAQVVPDAPPEPMDGCFVAPDVGSGGLTVLGVFGLHPARAAMSLAEVAGFRPESIERPDGTPPFAPALPGADRAGLLSLVGADELLELAWRAAPLLDEAPGSDGIPAGV